MEQSAAAQQQIRDARIHMTPQRFLAEMFSMDPASEFHNDSCLLVWTQKDKESKFFDTPAAAAAWIDIVKHHTNVYFGCSLGPKGLGPKQRFGNKDALAIPGVWLDLDYLSSGHKKTNLPANEFIAWEFIKEFPLRPSLVIHSGGGYQLWWLFPGVWFFEDERDKLKAQGLVLLWQQAFKRLAQRHGWDIDSTHDFARVFRPAGTLNHKHTPPLDVTVQEWDNKRYNPTELMMHLGVREDRLIAVAQESASSDSGDGIAPRLHVVEGSIRLDYSAEPPFDKVQSLFDFDQKAEASWKHQRPDLTDQSLSSYDMALATRAMSAGWDDQEIVNLLIAHRRKWSREASDPEKVMRLDYYIKTLNRARLWIEQESAKKNAENIIRSTEEIENGNVTKDQLLRAISDKIGVQITRIVKFTSDPAVYRIWSGDKELELGDASALLDQNVFRKRMLDLASVVVQRMKQDLWDGIVTAMMSVIEELDPGAEASPVSQLKRQIAEYLGERPPVDKQGKWKEAAIGHMPFMLNGYLYISTGGQSGFGMYVYIHTGQRVQGKKLAVLMRAAGWEYHPTSIFHEGRSVSRGLWRRNYDESEFDLNIKEKLGFDDEDGEETDS